MKLFETLFCLHDYRELTDTERITLIVKGKILSAMLLMELPKEPHVCTKCDKIKFLEYSPVRSIRYVD